MTPAPQVVYLVVDIWEFEYEKTVGVFSTEEKAEDCVSRREAAQPEHYADGSRCWLEVDQYTVDEELDSE